MNCQILIVCQIGKISPKLVTLDKFLFLKKTFFFKTFLQTLILEKEQKSNSL